MINRNNRSKRLLKCRRSVTVTVTVTVNLFRQKRPVLTPVVAAVWVYIALDIQSTPTAMWNWYAHTYMGNRVRTIIGYGVVGDCSPITGSNESVAQGFKQLLSLFLITSPYMFDYLRIRLNVLMVRSSAFPNYDRDHIFDHPRSVDSCCHRFKNQEFIQ